MTTEKQHEVIRLWNQLRKLEGPAAEELRIQILECFSEKGGAKRAGSRSVRDNQRHAATTAYPV
ncbi:MAG: hypothetical protein ACJ8EL_18770 [Rhizomicrobium sp.]